MAALLSSWPETQSVTGFAAELGGTIGAALRDGKADLSSCKLSQSCVENGVDLSNDVLAHGAHGDEKLVDKDGSVFLATPAEWKAALQARLGTPRHCKDVAHALQRSGILFTNDSLQLLDCGAKHSLEGFTGDAWLFELPANNRGGGAKKQPRGARSPQHGVAADGHGGR